MSGPSISGLSTVCATCDSEIDFPDGPSSELGICRHCGEAFLFDVEPKVALAEPS